MKVTAQPPVSPVSVEEVAAYLGLDDLSPTDPSYALLDGLLDSAAYSVEKYINAPVERRLFSVRMAMPYSGTRFDLKGLSGTQAYKAPVRLPYAVDVSITEVKINDETVLSEGDDYKADGYQVSIRPSYDVVVIQYDSGSDPVPGPVLTGIKQLTAYLYEHRGACSAEDALMKSGAAATLQPFRVEWHL